ncbi:hypothetical protein CPLU01_15382 [Colletotrichum plurivorum]|uniref:Uncharacterized protein n=1 Tax=Colletotrichum plurivorum TaxID=2175906 RepID=A0A8H6JCK4_9PEZI|nr:hypothetical protein CPLU01_15382 [Colletotrichum plurivorum]
MPDQTPRPATHSAWQHQLQETTMLERLRRRRTPGGERGVAPSSFSQGGLNVPSSCRCRPRHATSPVANRSSRQVALPMRLPCIVEWGRCLPGSQEDQAPTAARVVYLAGGQEARIARRVGDGESRWWKGRPARVVAASRLVGTILAPTWIGRDRTTSTWHQPLAGASNGPFLRPSTRPPHHKTSSSSLFHHHESNHDHNNDNRRPRPPSAIPHSPTHRPHANHQPPQVLRFHLRALAHPLPFPPPPRAGPGPTDGRGARPTMQADPQPAKLPYDLRKEAALRGTDDFHIQAATRSLCDRRTEGILPKLDRARENARSIYAVASVVRYCAAQHDKAAIRIFGRATDKKNNETIKTIKERLAKKPDEPIRVLLLPNPAKRLQTTLTVAHVIGGPPGSGARPHGHAHAFGPEDCPEGTPDAVRKHARPQGKSHREDTLDAVQELYSGLCGGKDAADGETASGKYFGITSNPAELALLELYFSFGADETQQTEELEALLQAAENWAAKKIRPYYDELSKYTGNISRNEDDTESE